MLNRERLNKVIGKLHRIGAEQMLITDPPVIYWLCGKWIWPGERFLGLLISETRAPVMFVNRLFEFSENIGVRVIWYSDSDDIIPMLVDRIDLRKLLAVDKTMAAGFLIPLMNANAAKGFVNGSIAVDGARAQKDSLEIELMRKSSKINDLAMAEFKGLVHEGVTEKEIADQTLKIYRRLGASGFSFDPIVSFGANAADPHHMPDDTVLKEGDCVLLDIGCVYENYCSDMTRTFYFRREPDERIRNIYHLVRKANEAAEDMLKAGIPLSSVDRQARSIIEEGGYGPYFNHRLGHFIGLQDHEAGDVSLSNQNLTEAGNIFSIEPGIYLKGDTGVRIEDLVLITEDGHEVLNQYPKEIEIIE